MAKIAHRASFLQAFHSGISETQRKASIEVAKSDTMVIEAPVTVSSDDTGTRKLPAGQKVGRGYVRTISDKQVKLILKLINERDLTGLNILPGQTINPTEIPNMGVKGGTALIDKLFAQPMKATTSVRMATANQKRFITSLNDQIINPEWKLTNDQIDTITFAQVNETIECLKDIILSEKKIALTNPATADITPGIYRNDKGTFKVYKARSGSHLLAKKLIDDEWIYQGAANRFVKAAEKISIEEAKEYGKRTGNCMVCSRELTNPDSIEAGIGPICASKF